jgi:hypothetical protein
MIQKLYTEDEGEQLLVTQQLRRLLSKGMTEKHANVCACIFKGNSFTLFGSNRRAY